MAIYLSDPVQRYPSILDFFYAFEYAIQPQPLQLHALVEDKDNPDDAHNAYESRTIQVLDSATAAPSIPMEPIMLL